MNKAKFILNTGTTKEEIHMKIFLWDYREKLIVSDIDGTITKSDIAGQLLNNYIHLGVTKLFAEAYKRGYKIVYLTARAIGQYNQTTKFLESA
jgi:phosphatidate phosphatase LPIN